MGHTAGVAGLEPANAGVKVPCLTTWRHPIAGCPPHDAADRNRPVSAPRAASGFAWRFFKSLMLVELTLDLRKEKGKGE